MSVSSTEHLSSLDTLLYGRPAGRNIIGAAIDEIKALRTEVKRLGGADAAQSFDDNEVHTAMCIWEEVLDRLNDDYAPQNKWETYRSNFGTATLRQHVIEFARPIEDAWEAMHPDEFDDPFDWEFVPLFLDVCVTYTLELVPDPVATMRQALRERAVPPTEASR